MLVFLPVTKRALAAPVALGKTKYDKSVLSDAHAVEEKFQNTELFGRIFPANFPHL